MPAVAEPVVKCGALLVRKLASTGTGESKLAPCRKLLADVHRAEQDRIASADEVLAVLVKSGAPEGTLIKARTIIAQGEWRGPADVAKVPIEVQLLGPGAVVEWEAEQKAALEPKKPEGGRQNVPGVFGSPVDPSFVDPTPLAEPVRRPSPAGKGK